MLAFLTSVLSATALTGLFFKSRFSILINDLLLILLPFHPLGTNGLIGVMASLPFNFKTDLWQINCKLYYLQELHQNTVGN